MAVVQRQNKLRRFGVSDEWHLDFDKPFRQLSFEFTAGSGGTKTIFELQEMRNEKIFTKTELKEAIDAINSPLEIDFTKEEQAKMATARVATAKRMVSEKSASDAKQRQKDADAKVRRTQSYVDSGKLLLNKNNFPGAKKQFEKAIAESPDSQDAKEAQKLIDRLPK